MSIVLANHFHNQTSNQMNNHIKYMLLKSFTKDSIEAYFKFTFSEINEALEEIGCYFTKGSFTDYFVTSPTLEGLNQFCELANIEEEVVAVGVVSTYDLTEE